ncbi:hypothetical protein BVY01_01745 [bacterium I07]|nr:hypothetical protein BVY01_01745 [bacterium I07]
MIINMTGLSFGLISAQVGDYEVKRLNQGNPVISEDMFKAVGADAREGEKINFPCVVRIPDWVEPENRADSTAVYYMYFAHHQGEYIRLAWAVHVEGPWHLYRTGSDIPVGKRGVIDMVQNGRTELHLGSNITMHKHIASPDLHIDHENRTFILYLHSPCLYNSEDIHVHQQTFVAVDEEDYGLDFNGDIQTVILGESYFRVFSFRGELYSIANRGLLYKAVNPLSPWTVPDNFNYSTYLWTERTDNPFQTDMDRAGLESSLRHCAVFVDGDMLEIYFSRKKDPPERILMSTIDMSSGEFTAWDPSWPHQELVRAEEAWEGGNLPVENDINALLDPFVFQEAGGPKYMFYSGGKENAIGVAELVEKGSTGNHYREANVIESFDLYSNYPNPFNGSTTISFQLDESVFVSMKLYNLRGELVHTLLEDWRPAGKHHVIWRPAEEPSGTYLGCIVADGQRKTIKITYLK